MIYDSILKTVTHIPTAGMEYEEWLKKRNGGIGGSDAGAVMGMNSFASPLTVYLQKKGLVPAQETSRAAQRGKILEPVIRQRTVDEFPALHIESVPFMFTNSVYPFMLANIDGVVSTPDAVNINGQDIQGLGGHEIKSAKTSYGWGDNEIPDSYYCQIQHYMAVLGLPWFMVSVYILDGDEIRHYIVRRNAEFIEKLIAAEKDFWENYIVPGVMPAAIGIENEDDMITGMFEGSKGLIALTNEEIALCQRYKSFSDQIKDIEKQKDAVGIELKAKLIVRKNPDKTEKKLSASGGGFSVSWSFFLKHNVDSDALKKAGIFEQYCKITETDRMTITSKKKKGAA